LRIEGKHWIARAGQGLVCLLATIAVACGPPASQPETGVEEAASSVVVYSGRNEALIGPLLERFEAAEGIEVEARYGGTAELAATLLEEGANTPADVYISQDAAALGALAGAGLLKPVEPAQLERVPARFRSPKGLWVGLSGRARAVVYNTGLVAPDDLPQSLDEVAETRFEGRFGIAPANASFQAHLAVHRALAGAEASDELMGRIAANGPRDYPKNSAIVAAVIAGEIDWGLTNHYYLWRAKKEQPEAPAANHFMPGGDASAFVNLAGAGVLSGNPAAARLIAFLLSDEAQRYFAEETYEFPLVAGVPAAADLPPLDSLATPEIDFSAVSAVLEETLTAINQSGLLQ
jgi:iron(III) transport system substrate-binding protein